MHTWPIDYNGRMAGRIAVNARAVHHRSSGVGRYTREITCRLGDRVRLLKSGSATHGFQGHLWEQVIIPRQLERDEVLWSPANSGPLAVTRQVITIHDISPIDQPDGFNFSFRTWYRVLMPQLAKRSKAIITDSEFSRQRIIERFGISPEKVESIPCGVDKDHFYPRPADEIAAIRRRYDLPATYLLSVGALEPRKNYARLFRAWEKARSDNKDVTLLVLGSSGRPFQSLRIEHIPEGLMFLPRVRERDLPALYSGALAFIFPSMYEGFGLPVLEAMACGTPVIVSNAGALPEVVAGAGRLVDPANVAEITQAIIQFIAEPDLRENFLSAGLSRAEEFSWDQASSRVISVLERVSSEP